MMRPSRETAECLLTHAQISVLQDRLAVRASRVRTAAAARRWAYER